MSLKEKLSFLNYDNGMSYCGDMEDLYIEILSVYAEGKLYENIKEYCNSKDWDNYIIKTHALKGTSLTIGAEELSEQAKALEMAAREGNTEYIDANTQNVLEEYKVIVEKIREALGLQY